MAFDWLISADADSVPDFRKQMREIGKKFIATSLETMQPSNKATLKETIVKVSQVVEDAAKFIYL